MPNILKTKELTEAIGLSRTTIYRLERAGKFPRRIRLGPNSVGWDAHEISEWLATLPRGFTNAQQTSIHPMPQQVG